jgi:hypothetical protein
MDTGVGRWVLCCWTVCYFAELCVMLLNCVLCCWTVIQNCYTGKRVKGKGHPITGHEGPTGGVEVRLYSFSTLALGGGRCSALRPGRFTPRKYPVPIVQDAGWAPGPVSTCAKYIAPTGIRSPDSPARCQSLYRLSYPAHYTGKKLSLKSILLH